MLLSLNSQEDTRSLEDALAEIARQICFCSFNSSSFNGSQVSCSGDGNTLMLTTTVQFASESGDVVASDVIRAVQNWAQTTPNAALTVGSNSAPVLQVCSPLCVEVDGESTSDVTSSLIHMNSPVFLPVWIEMTSYLELNYTDGHLRACVS